MTNNWQPPAEKVQAVAPAGNHVGRCIQIIDLGSHDLTWEGITKEVRSIRITWELPTELYTFKDENGPEPFIVSGKYSLSFGPKATLKKLIDSWEGKKITGEEIQSMKWKLPDLLGKPCLVSVAHNPGKDGKMYANVQTVTPLPKGMDCPAQINPSVFFFMGWTPTADDLDEKMFADLPDFIKKQIADSPEFILCRELKAKQV